MIVGKGRAAALLVGRGYKKSKLDAPAYKSKEEVKEIERESLQAQIRELQSQLAQA
jgi:hypothetical protein